jgi:hypothetical protein
LREQRIDARGHEADGDAPHLAALRGARDDALAMQYLIPGWKFDPKRPALVR